MRIFMADVIGWMDAEVEDHRDATKIEMHTPVRGEKLRVVVQAVGGNWEVMLGSFTIGIDIVNFLSLDLNY